MTSAARFRVVLMTGLLRMLVKAIYRFLKQHRRRVTRFPRKPGGLSR
jgi:hypothetical protein